MVQVSRSWPTSKSRVAATALVSHRLRSHCAYMLSHVLLPSLAVPDMPSTQTGAGTRPRASSAAGWSWSVWLVGSIETKGTATPSRAGGKFCFATGFSSVRAELFGMPRRLLAPSCSLTRVCVSEGRVAPQASSSERPSVMKSGKRMRQLVSDGVFPKLVATIKGVDSHQFGSLGVRRAESTVQGKPQRSTSCPAKQRAIKKRRNNCGLGRTTVVSSPAWVAVAASRYHHRLRPLSRLQWPRRAS